MAGTESSSVASYVVRIYRHTIQRDERPESIAGLVENVHDNERCAFHSMAELWNILRVSDAHQRVHKSQVDKVPNRSTLHGGKDRQ